MAGERREQGRAPRAQAKPKVAIAGGGLAGLAAATVLAERGARVTVLEKERFLGGRVGSWPDALADGTPFEMERGFHAFFRNYHNLRALLRRVDPDLSTLQPLTDYPLLGPEGRQESFSGLPLGTPWNLIALTARTPSLRLVDLPRVGVGRALAMLAFDSRRTYARYDHMTAREYLDSLRFPPRARQMLFEVFAHSFFNPEERYSAAELLAMFHFYFVGNPQGLVFDVMREPFGAAFIEPTRRRLESLGVTFELGVEVQRVERRDGSITLHTSDGAKGADALVLALPVAPLRAVVSRSPGLFSAPMTRRIDSLERTLPFVVLRLFVDRPPHAERAPFAGTAGVGILDNISIYERIEGQSAAWARDTGHSIIELHAYGVAPEIAADEARLRRELRAGMEAIYPETRGHRVIEERLLVRDDCPAFAPGSDALRPTVDTDAPDVMLAGDFIKLPFPSALMERATSSGMLAANALVSRFGLGVPEPVMEAPRRGLLAL